MLEPEDPLYQFLDTEDRDHMETSWVNIHHTELTKPLTFPVPDDVYVGHAPEHLTRVRMYANAVAAHQDFTLRPEHTPVYNHNDNGVIESITLETGWYGSGVQLLLPRTKALDETGMMTVYLTRVGIEQALTLEERADSFISNVIPNLVDGVTVCRPQILEGSVVLRCAIIRYKGNDRKIHIFPPHQYTIEENDDGSVTLRFKRDAAAVRSWGDVYDNPSWNPVRLEFWWEPEHEYILAEEMDGF